MKSLTITHDGNVLVHDRDTGVTVSRPSYSEALAEIERLNTARPVKAMPGAWSPWRVPTDARWRA